MPIRSTLRNIRKMSIVFMSVGHSLAVPIRSPLRNIRKMSIIFMSVGHSLAVWEDWIDCFLTSSLSIILVSSCDMHTSSTVTFPAKTSSCKFPTAPRSINVVSQGRVIDCSHLGLVGNHSHIVITCSRLVTK